MFFLFALVQFSHQQNQDRIIVDSYDQGDIGVLIVLPHDVATTDPPLTNQTFFTSPDGINSTSILGGERDLQYSVTFGTTNRVFSSSVTSGEWEISTPNGGDGFVNMQYDGLDGGSMNLKPNGLIGVQGNTDGFDLTEIGKTIAFHVIAQTDHNTTYTFDVYSPDGSKCEAVIDVPGGTVTTDTFVYFVNFTGTCDFTKVGAIEVFVDALENVDTITTLFTTYGAPDTLPSNSPSPGSSPSPSPSPSPSNIPGFTWYTQDDDFEHIPCDLPEPPRRSYFVSDQHIVYYYFYQFDDYYNVYYGSKLFVLVSESSLISLSFLVALIGFVAL